MIFFFMQKTAYEMRISGWSSDVCSSDLYLPHIDRVLRLLDCKVRVYGTRRRGEDDNLDFRAPSVQGFIDDVAGCRAVLSTAGNQLIGEALHLDRKSTRLNSSH